MSRPNILFLIADDHRYDAIGAVGNATVQTPHLDALMARGTTFTENHHMGSYCPAVCLPARAMLLTGRYLFHAPDPLPPDVPLLPQLLREAGYFTYGVGKWHNRRETFARSFSGGANIFFGGMSQHTACPVYDFDPNGTYAEDAVTIKNTFSTDLFGDSAIQFLDDYNDAAPFMLYCAFTAPHDPRTPPPDFSEFYDPDAIPLPENFLPEHPFDNGELRIRDELLAAFPRSEGEIQQHIADYYAMISDMDAKIGEILAALERNGFTENTIVVYTADHGLAVGQHGLMGKQNLYEHSTHIPLIIAGPEIPANVQQTTLTYTSDICPTLLERAGVALPPTVQTASLNPVIAGAKESHRRSLFCAYQNEHSTRHGDYQRSVRNGRWKLIEYYVADVNNVIGTRRTQLFDLENDPRELHDVFGAAELAETVAWLRRELALWREAAGDPFF